MGGKADILGNVIPRTYYLLLEYSSNAVSYINVESSSHSLRCNTLPLFILHSVEGCISYIHEKVVLVYLQHHSFCLDRLIIGAGSQSLSVKRYCTLNGTTVVFKVQLHTFNEFTDLLHPLFYVKDTY